MPQASTPPSTAFAIDPRLCDRLEAAQRALYKIGRCDACGGPELFAKSKPAAKCLRCGRYRTLDAIGPHAKRHRCLSCWKIFYAPVNWQKCERCRAKSKVNGPSQRLGRPRRVTPQTPSILSASAEPIFGRLDPDARPLNRPTAQRTRV